MLPEHSDLIDADTRLYSNARPPSKLHRIHGFDAMQALRAAAGDRGPLADAPDGVLAGLVGALAKHGFYIGVRDHDA